MPIIGTLAGASARGFGGLRTFAPAGPVITQWISNVVNNGSGNINIVDMTMAIPSTGLIYCGGGGAGIGNCPSWWVQDTTGTYLQKKQFGGLTGWFMCQLYGDTTGNIYTAVGSGAGDIVAAKMDSTGTILWAKNVNGGTSGAMATSPDGSRMLVRSTSAEADKWAVLDGSDGSVVYARQSASRNTQNAYMFKMSNTKIYTSGYERDGSNQGFVRQYTTSTGNQDWSVWYDDGQYSVGTSVFYDSSGNVYAGGYHASGNYFVKMNSSGTLQWARQLGGGQQFPKQGAVDSAGNIYTLHNDGTLGYIIKFNSSGTVQWQRYISGQANPGSSNSGNIEVLNDTNILVTFSSSDGTRVNAYQMIIPTDGSKTGSYTVGGKTISYQPSSLSISSKGGTMSGSQGSSAVTMTVTNAGLGAVTNWSNTTGLTNI